MEYPFLPVYTQVFESCIDLVVRSVYPDQVYLLATKSNWNCFFPAEEQQGGPAFLLLILCPLSNGHQAILQNRIESCVPGSFACILQSTEDFHERLSNADYFASHVSRHAFNCYSNFCLPKNFSESKEVKTPVYHLSEPGQLPDHLDEFFALIHHQPVQACLCLRQVVLSILTQSIEAFIGYLPHSGNLTRLLKYAAFSPRGYPLPIFHNDCTARVIQLLDAAFMHFQNNTALHFNNTELEEVIRFAHKIAAQCQPHIP